MLRDITLIFDLEPPIHVEKWFPSASRQAATTWIKITHLKSI